MDKKGSAVLFEEYPHQEHSTMPTRREVLEQLERLVSSTHFRNSKRYPALLRFIVEETLAGRGEALKERTLGVQVFGRPPAYDSNADPVVRVSAGEIRKRIAQYYQTPEHGNELRFELPLGSYAPLFLAPPREIAGHAEPRRMEHLDRNVDSQPETAAHEADQQPEPHAAGAGVSPAVILGSGRWQHGYAKIFLVLAVIGTLIALAFWVSNLNRERQLQTGVSFFWQPLLASKQGALIVIGVHSLDKQGQDTSPASSVSSPVGPQSMLSSMTQSDMISISDLMGYSEIVTILAREGHTFKTQGSSDTTLEQLRAGPVVLVGGFNNNWTMRLTSKLRFRFITETSSINAIRDSEAPAVRWQFDAGQNALSDVSDYAIVASFFDPDIEQQVFLAAGIGRHGTEAAAEFLTSNNYLTSWMTSVHITRHQNVEIVLSTQIIEGKHGPPRVIASAQW